MVKALSHLIGSLGYQSIFPKFGSVRSLPTAVSPDTQPITIPTLRVLMERSNEPNGDPVSLSDRH
ncbi:hypothetical protein QTO30_15695 [Yoonia sp. GPGPB17]|uniref:hypothetical protein n=1 Tax=Yoonia sp. GPGPB17 TaxID=3026147 RepID=UPI0030C1CF92